MIEWGEAFLTVYQPGQEKQDIVIGKVSRGKKLGGGPEPGESIDNG